MNVIAIIGNLTANPELKTNPQGISVCTFSLAVHRPNTKDVTDFINCVAWRGLAELLSKYCSKGQKIAVDGYLTSRKWIDKNQNNRTSFEVICNNITFCGAPVSKSRENLPEAAQAAPDADDFTPVIDDGDLPF